MKKVLFIVLSVLCFSAVVNAKEELVHEGKKVINIKIYNDKTGALLLDRSLKDNEYHASEIVNCTTAKTQNEESEEKIPKCDSEGNLITGLEIKSDPHGWIETPYKNGKAEGIQKSFLSVGYVETSFKNGKKDGTERFYGINYNGKTKYKEYFEQETLYKDDKKVWEKRYYSEGRLRMETFYKDGKKDGVEKRYRGDGTLEGQTTFIDGKEEGISKFFGGNGMNYETLYKNGKKEFEKEYYSDGTLAREILYKDGKKDGISKMYSPKGVLLFETPYKAGLIDGIARKYNEDGSLKKETKYKKGKKILSDSDEKTDDLSFIKEYEDEQVAPCHENEQLICDMNGNLANGILKRYDSGTVVVEIPIKNGKIDGTLRNYYYDGLLWTETSFVNGKKEGVQVIYLENEEKIETYYKDEKPVGEQKFYRRNRVDKKFIFKDGKAVEGYYEYSNGNEKKLKQKELDEYNKHFDEMMLLYSRIK